MFKVVVSPRAWNDFFEIHEYIAAENDSAAADFSRALLEHIDLLGTFPHLGIASSNTRGVRSVLHTPIRIYYRIDESRDCVEIIHFWHTARRKPAGV
jgi:plasmid stabilization system protein ParE